MSTTPTAEEFRNLIADELEALAKRVREPGTKNNKRNNLRITVDGETATLAEWSRRTGVRSDTIRARLLRGWPVRRAVWEAA